MKNQLIEIINKYYKELREYNSPPDAIKSILCVLYVIHKKYTITNNFQSLLQSDASKDFILLRLTNCIFRNELDLYRMYHELLNISYNIFQTQYISILEYCFRMFSKKEHQKDFFIRPLYFDILIAFLINSLDCNSVYDPFCGVASIVNFFKKREILYEGGVDNDTNKIFALLNIENVYGSTTKANQIISKEINIDKWKNSKYDAVVLSPPIHIESFYKRFYEKGINDIGELYLKIYSRAHTDNNADFVITLLPTQFCGSEFFLSLRQTILSKNLLDTIITFPNYIKSDILFNPIIIITRKERELEDPIKIINTNSFFDEKKGEIFFKQKEFKKAIETGSLKRKHMSREEFIKCDFLINPISYNSDFDINKKYYPIDNLINEFHQTYLDTENFNGGVFLDESLNNDFIKILLNRNSPLVGLQRVNEITEMKVYHTIINENYVIYKKNRLRKPEYYRNSINDNYSSSEKPLYALYKGGYDIICSKSIIVMKINEDIVTPEYLIYVLLNNELSINYGIPLEVLMKMKVGVEIEDIVQQKNIVNRIIQQYDEKKRLEREADAKRLGIQQNISDLEHMLGPTQFRIGRIFSSIQMNISQSKDCSKLFKELKDNVDYMNRIIKYSYAKINEKDLHLKKNDIIDFIKNYCNSWNNYSGNYFDLSLDISLQKERNILFDKTFLSVLLDSILTNAERHGFDKTQQKGNKVNISISEELCFEKPYIIIRIANNGHPFPTGFTMNDYITRGRFSADTGRSGLGGYHVYKIAKGHQGFIYIGSNMSWNTFIDILLPSINTINEYLKIYEHENECI